MKSTTENIYKGFIELKNGSKSPITKFKDLDKSEYLTYKYAKRKSSFGGILKEDIIMIDVDNAEKSQILYQIILDLNINCNILKTTKGMHFYFKNTDVKTNKSSKTINLAVGIDETDIKLGIKNTVDPLKISGLMREWLMESDNIQELPKWLTPIKKSNINFFDLQDGDGRNQILFNYILTLQSEGFSQHHVKETIQLINKYILKTPLDEKEIETILRDEAFQKPMFYIGTKLQYEKLATYIRDNYNIIKINDRLHIYKEGVYLSNENEIEKILLNYINNSTHTIRKEVLRYLELICRNVEQTSYKYVLFNNGVLNLETKILEEHSSKFIFKNKIYTNYNTSAYDKLLDKTLNKICCNDKDLRLVIEEMIGYMLLRRNELGKCFILTGGGSNGKSTLLEIIKKMIGDINISSVSLEELSERFKTYQLEGKLVNIGDDISNKYIEDNATFKKLATGEKVNVERKGKDPFDFENYSKLVFSANEMPRINDFTDGLKRRLLFIPFNAKFTVYDDDFDPYIKDKLTSSMSMEYLIKLAIDGLNRLLINNSFTSCEACADVAKEYEQLNNPIIAFIEEFKIENELTDDVYRQYSVWCSENNFKAVSKPRFCKIVCNMCNFKIKVKKLEGKCKKMFEKLDVRKA